MKLIEIWYVNILINVMLIVINILIYISRSDINIIIIDVIVIILDTIKIFLIIVPQTIVLFKLYNYIINSVFIKKIINGIECSVKDR